MHPLRVWRVEAGQEWYVRMLSQRYGGLWVHWKGRSRYCNPAGCEPSLHRTERFWKGYCAAEVWQPQQQVWLPVCLELTEHVELDLRGRYERGQVWLFKREKEVGKKRMPVQAVLAETTDPLRCGPAPDYMGCLCHLYHVERIDLSAKNPMPDRTMVIARPGDGPAALAGEIDPSPEEKAKVQEMIASNRNRFRMPANGTKHS